MMCCGENKQTQCRCYRFDSGGLSFRCVCDDITQNEWFDLRWRCKKTLIQYRNIMCSDTVSILKNIIDFIFNSLQAKIHGSRKTVIITLCAGLLSDFSWRVSCQRWQANKSVCYFTLAVFHFILGLITQSVNVAPPLTEALQLYSRFLEALMTRHSRSAAQVLCSDYSACC